MENDEITPVEVPDPVLVAAEDNPPVLPEPVQSEPVVTVPEPEPVSVVSQPKNTGVLEFLTSGFKERYGS